MRTSTDDAFCDEIDVIASNACDTSPECDAICLVAARFAATKQMASHSGEVSHAFDAITAISSQNASSVEVLTYVNAEITSAAQNILASVDEMNRRAAAIDGEFGRYTISDNHHTQETPV